MGGSRRGRQRLRRLPQPTGNFVWPCCKRPRLARTSRWPVPEGNTIRRTLRGAPNFLLANTARMNRHDGPEEGALPDRCLTGGLPEFGTAYGGSFRRIVQTPGGISMFYDVGQGQGWQRNIVM